MKLKISYIIVLAYVICTIVACEGRIICKTVVPAVEVNGCQIPLCRIAKNEIEDCLCQSMYDSYVSDSIFFISDLITIDTIRVPARIFFKFSESKLREICLFFSETEGHRIRSYINASIQREGYKVAPTERGFSFEKGEISGNLEFGNNLLDTMETIYLIRP